MNMQKNMLLPMGPRPDALECLTGTPPTKPPPGALTSNCNRINIVMLVPVMLKLETSFQNYIHFCPYSATAVVAIAQYNQFIAFPQIPYIQVQCVISGLLADLYMAM